MVGLILYFDLGLCIIDSITISALRRFLIDFLIDSCNRKSAKRVHREQSFSQRVTLAYIRSFLKRNMLAFQRFHRLYMALLYTIPLQYVMVAACNVLFYNKSIYVVALFALVKLIIALFIRTQTDSNLISRYRRK